MIYFFLILFLLAINSLAVYVLVKNKLSKISIIHFLTTLFFSAWAASTVLAENLSGDIAVNNTFNRLSYLFAYLGLVSLYIFSRQFSKPYKQHQSKTWHRILALILFILVAIFFTSDDVVGVVVVSSDGQYLFQQGSLVMVTVLIDLILAFAVIRNLLIRIKNGNYAEKNQARFIIFAMVVAFVVGLGANILAPALTNGENETGPINVLLLTVLLPPISYALLTHRLTDIRPLASRFIATIFFLVTMVLIYALVILSINSIFFDDSSIPNPALFIYIVVLIVVGLLVHPLQSFFRKLTDGILIKNLYEPQKVIDELNNVLVSNLKTTPLLNEIQTIIRRNIGSNFTIIKLNQKHTKLYHQGRESLTLSDLAALDNAYAKIYPGRKRMVSIRDIAIDNSKKNLSELMISEKIDIIAPINHGGVLLGMLYLSDKKYQLPYSNKDLKIIEIIVNQTGLAIQNTSLFEEVTELNKNLQDKVLAATRQLRQTNQQLLSIDKAKDEFISISSHQLRTPLTTVKGYLSMLLDGNFGKVQPKMREPLEQSLDNTQRISFVVSDLLNLVRLRTNKLEINQTPVNIVEIVESEVKALTDRIRHKGLYLDVNIPNNSVVLYLDEIKIRQVIKNFIYNAIFYTPTGGKLLIELEESADSVRYFVHDTGIGVPLSDQKHLFAQFYRAQNAREIRPDGTGVGLFISKAVIKAHGGKILFKSKVGKGSTFGFELSKKFLVSETNLNQ